MGGVGTPLVPDPTGTSPRRDDDGPLGDVLRPYVVVALVAAAMWVLEIIDLIPGTPFDRWGIRPREIDGLVGVPLAPFLHSGFGHLLANTLPFVILGGAIAAGGIARWLKVTLIVGAVSGLGVWLFAAPRTIHLGASGLVFGYLTYLLSRGVIARKASWLLGGLIVLLVYGGVLWGLLPRPGVSWTGHLFGAIGGVVAAWVLHRTDAGQE